MNMQEIKVIYYSKHPHLSQILTGFYQLAEKGHFKVTFQDGKSSEFDCQCCAEVRYRGKVLIYDTNDGYHDVPAMAELLKKCDFYFKRSFIPQRNRELFGELAEKIYPLGMNYHTTYKGNPLNPPEKKTQFLKNALGMPSSKYFRDSVFEGKTGKVSHPKRILFYTRLWQEEASLPEQINEERRCINVMRIAIIRDLRKRYGRAFQGGVENSPVAKQLCPDLILPRWKTRRNNYLRRLHRSDICIGSTGLHGSIGWKTGEYVAAAKAIVCEKITCALPGDFAEEKNYLAFETVEQCVLAVERLLQNPELWRTMQKNNLYYYRSYLKPDALIGNTLRIADSQIDS